MSVSGSFANGTRVWVQGRPAVVRAATPPQKALVHFDGDATPREVDLLAAYTAGAVQWEAPQTSPVAADTALEHIAEEAWAEATRREAILQPLLVGRRTVVALKAVSAEQKVPLRTLYRWLAAFDQGGKRALVPDTARRGGPGRLRLPADREALLTETLQRFYLTRSRPSLQHAHAQIVAEFRNKRLAPPTLRTVRRRIAAMNVARRVHAREGSKAARRHTVSRGAFPSGSRPLQTILIDHTPLDIQLVDDADRTKVIGRPFLTLAMDACTRMIYGWFLTLDPPSYLSVAMCLLQGALPKDDVCTRFKLAHPWPIHGLPETVHMDNGKDFRSKNLERWAEQYDVGMEFRPVRTPQYGGFIERVIGTLNRVVQNLEGTTKSSVAAKGDYDSEAAAVYTIGEIEEFLARRIVDGYHTAVHSELLKSPLAAWNDAMARDLAAPTLPSDPARFRIDILPCEERTIQKDGVSLFGLHYTDGVLQTWRARSGTKASQAKYVVKYDPRDLSRVHFIPPEDGAAPLAIPIANRTVGPFSLLELRRTQALAKVEHRAWSEHILPELLQREHAALSDAQRKSKAARRDAARIRRHRDTATPAHATAPARPEAPPIVETVVPVWSDIAADGWGVPVFRKERP